MTDRDAGVPYGQGGALRRPLTFPVVGIGASAGGLAALRRLFEQAPATGGLAYVVILDLSPRHQRQASQELRHCTPMPVIEVNAPTPIEPNHVYVIAPTTSLTMDDGYLGVRAVDRPAGRHIAIDAFFRTLADAHMDRAIGIVLSGTGSDGSVGLARLKAQGGVAIAQLPEDAEYEDMPRSAIASGCVDFVLPAVEIPGKLVALWRDARQIQLPRPEPRAEHNPATAPSTGEARERAIRDILEILAQVHQRVLAAHAPPPVDDRRTGDGEALLQLEQELQRTRDRLQVAIAQSEASNEELQSIKAALRSATGELEASKEELRSVNEELIRVNHELKSKVEETAKINDELQTFFSATDIATVFVDAGLRIKRYTPKAELIFNIIPGDVGRCLLDITHRLEYPELGEDAGNAFETLQPIEREIRSTDGKGYVARVVPYRTAGNRIDGAVLTFIDTTSLRSAGERRGQADASVLAPTDVAVLVADGQRQVISASGGVVDLLGYGERDLLGTRVDALYGQQERDSGQPEHDFVQAGAGMAVEGLRWYRNCRGDRIQCRVALSAIRAQDEVVAYVLLLGARRQGGARSWAGRYEAETSVTLRDEFLAVMSHELKNPLNLISVNTELMARLPGVRESSSAIASIETVRRAIRSQTKIIDDLLDMSRIRTGKLTLKPEPVDVGMVVTELVDVARLDPASVGIAFGMQIPDAPIMVRGDASRIEQIVWNLLSNAIKFTPQGGQISLMVGGEAHYVRLRVRDTGQGIDAQSLPRIFDLFGQGTGHAIGRGGGLGIGLSLVRQLVDLHGGRIEAHSDGPGRGATFTLWLPRFTYPLFGPGESDGRHEAMRWDGLRILVVDDDVGTADGLAQLLELQGASVVVCHDAAHALDRLDAQVFDLVLSDIGMDGMDGYAFARQARALAGADRLALVALSGYARPSDIQEASASGFDAHLSKPLSMDALAAAMRDVLAKRQPQA
ncbi:chemotaxis protein CheB [Luteimonas sp. TWI1437]|uniref:chemotaxis protein CheB n=1 Tax=unclassified Luteimonas TaxID=2629088 RepID=UPI003208C382